MLKQEIEFDTEGEYTIGIAIVDGQAVITEVDGGTPVMLHDDDEIPSRVYWDGPGNYAPVVGPRDHPVIVWRKREKAEYSFSRRPKGCLDLSGYKLTTPGPEFTARYGNRCNELLRAFRKLEGEGVDDARKLIAHQLYKLTGNPFLHEALWFEIEPLD